MAMSAKVQSIITAGSDGIVADIEYNLANSLPAIVIVGFANNAFDLAIAAAIMLASGQVEYEFSSSEALMGELGLDGSLRPVRGIIGKILAGRAKGITNFFIPAANLLQAQLVPRVTLYPVSELAGLYQHLCNMVSIKPVHTGDGIFPAEQPNDANTEPIELLTLNDVVGQL